MSRKRKDDEKAHALNVFLLKKSVTEIAEEIEKHRKGIEKRRVLVGDNDLGILFATSSSPIEPKWFDFFKGNLNEELTLRNMGSGAVFLIQHKETPFALTFGYGRSLLPKECWEENFGLFVTLNSVGADTVRQTDLLSLGARGKHTKIQTGQASPISELGIDFDQDLIREVVGAPSDLSFGKRLSGIDQVRLTPKVSLKNLPDLLEKLIQKYKSKDYLKQFPWVGRLKRITVSSKLDELNDVLIKRLRTNQLDQTWMAVPEIVDWNDIKGFYFGGDEEDCHEDIIIEDFLKTFRDQSTLSLSSLTSKRIVAIDLKSDQQIYDWPAFKCIYSEIDGDKELFILTEGKWYRIEKDFVKEINDFFDQIENVDLGLPFYTDASEGDYNERVCLEKSDKYACMDAKNIMITGRSKAEFCDIYSKDKKIIHVKHYKGAEGLSHLFMQGGNSATLFLADEKFRKAVDDLLPSTHKISSVDEKPVPGEYTVIFAVITSGDFKSKLTLPFFSRITLRKVHRDLTNYGYSVKLAKIHNSKAKVT